jgi:hypothetical protein
MLHEFPERHSIFWPVSERKLNRPIETDPLDMSRNVDQAVCFSLEDGLFRKLLYFPV